MATLDLSALWIHRADDFSVMLNIPLAGLTTQKQQTTSVKAMANGTLRAVTTPETRNQYRVILELIDRTQLAALESWTAIPLMIRDPFGRKLFGVMSTVPAQEQPIQNKTLVGRVSFTFDEITMTEEV